MDATKYQQQVVEDLIESSTLQKLIAVGSINDGSELFAQGDYEESWNHTLIALQSRPFNPEALTLLGAIAYMTGNYDVSKELFGVARSLVLNHSEIREIEKSLPAKINRGMLNLPQIGNFKNILRNINNLTVCIIAKNEEKNIERCISSVLPIASQVVVVDTGSTDSTVEIARSLGAEVYFVKWEDDFSAARNAAIRKAKCGWILSIDADEQILPEEHEKLINALNNRCAIAYRLPLVNAGKELEQYCYVPRLFRNAPGIFYKNRIHEQVFPSIINYGKKWGLRICKGNVVITHYGYKPELTTTKNQRNLNLLLMAINEQPQDANILMNLGLELCRSGKIDEGLANYGKAFDILSKMPFEVITEEMRETLLTQYSTFLFSKQKYSELAGVLTSKLANKLSGLNASQHYLLGVSYYKLKKINEAISELKQCINKLNQKTNSHALQDIYQGEPHYLLAICYAVLNKTKEAEREFSRAIKESPDSFKFNYDYARFLAGQGNLVKALELLNKIIPQNSSNPTVWQLGARIALNNHKFTEFALDWTQEALKYCPDNPELIEYRADALLLNGRLEEAIECFERLPENPRQQASIIFCEVINGMCNKSYDGIDERAVSYELIRLYRQCLNAQTVSLLNCFHKNIDCLHPILPTAYMILKQALNEANNL